MVKLSPNIEARIRAAYGNHADTAIHFIEQVATTRGLTADQVATANLARGQAAIDAFCAQMTDFLRSKPGVPS